METKQANKFNLVNFYGKNICENSLNEFKNCECYEKKIQCRLCINNDNNKQFEWYLSENKMFQYPRRRKLLKKHNQQGQRKVKNIFKMAYSWDNIENMDTIILQTPRIMLKSSVTMWNK